MKHRQFILSATGRIAAVVTLAFVVAGSAAAEGRCCITQPDWAWRGV